MSEAVRNMFDSIAHRYDFLNGFMSAGRDTRWRHHAVNLFPDGFSGEVLDLCGGTGDFVEEVGSHYNLSRAVVGDFSEGMLRAGMEKFRKKSRTTLQWVRLDAQKTPFPPESFDGITNAFGMRNLKSLEAGIEEAHRLLRPGGYFLTLEFFKPVRLVPRLFYSVIAPVFIPVAGFLFSGKARAYKYLVRSIQNFISVDDYCSWCENHGWEVAARHSCDLGMAEAILLRKK